MLRAKLEARKGRQSFGLPGPTAFRALALQVPAVTPGEDIWGSIGEVETEPVSA